MTMLLLWVIIGVILTQTSKTENHRLGSMMLSSRAKIVNHRPPSRPPSRWSAAPSTKPSYSKPTSSSQTTSKNTFSNGTEVTYKHRQKRVIPASAYDSVESLAPRLPSDEERLLELLFDGYNPSARPVLNSSHTVEVQVQFSLLQIQDLDLRSQVLTTTGLLIMDWNDERLKWNKNHIPLSDVVVEAKKLWRPEFASINGAEEIYGDYGQFRAVIGTSGSIHWEPGGIFKTVCQIDITYYPFDEQRCDLIFGAWSYHTTKMNLSNAMNDVNLDSYEQNGEWQIYRTDVRRGEFHFDCCPDERFANVAFHIYLRRRYTFYIMNVILPSLMTSVLLLSIFFCTPAQKVQIGVVVLLSFRIFLLNVTDSIPKTSDHIPLLGIYLTCTMAITTLSMVLTVFVLNLHHVSDRPVPRWLKKLILVYLARLMCMCSYDTKDDQQEEQERRNRYRVTPNSLGKAIGNQIGLLANLNGTLSPSNGPNSGNQKTSKSRTKSRGGGGGGGLITSGLTAAAAAADRHSMNFRSQYTYNNDSNNKNSDPKRLEEEWAKDWRHLAEVVDRLFFWLFLSAIVITTLLLFHPLTKSYFSILGNEAILGGKEKKTQQQL